MILTFKPRLTSQARARLATRFKLGDADVNVALSNFDSPADAYIALRIGEMSGRSTGYIVDKYKKHKGNGWGALAKSLGIKPGSEEFHALKRGHDLAKVNKHDVVRYSSYDNRRENVMNFGKVRGKGKTNNSKHLKFQSKLELKKTLVRKYYMMNFNVEKKGDFLPHFGLAIASFAAFLVIMTMNRPEVLAIKAVEDFSIGIPFILVFFFIPVIEELPQYFQISIKSVDLIFLLLGSLFCLMGLHKCFALASEKAAGNFTIFGILIFLLIFITGLYEIILKDQKTGKEKAN